MAQTYEIDIKRFNGQDYDTLLPTPAAHAATHQADGSDPIVLQAGNYGNETIPTMAYQNKSITRSKLANDALYSPINSIDTGITPSYTVTANDIGYTLTEASEKSSACEYIFDVTNLSTLPMGAEIGIVLLAAAGSATLVFRGVSVALAGSGLLDASASDVTLQISERFGMVVVKKLYVTSNAHIWLVTGNAEVVE